MENPVVLSFGDSIIRASELQILDTNSWLTDNIISFFFEYMSTEIFSKYKHKVAFVGPDFTQLLKLCAKNELNCLMASANLSDKDYVFFPINDSTSMDSPGGSHWSLLVCNLRSRWCRHYDSNSGVNETNALQLFNRLSDCLLNKNSNFEEVEECPQQSNGYDCGVFVIVNARLLAEHYLAGQPLRWLNRREYISMRKRLKHVICNVNDGGDILP